MLDEQPLFVTKYDDDIEVQKILDHNKFFHKNCDLFIYQNKLTTCKIGDGAVLIKCKRFNFENIYICFFFKPTSSFKDQTPLVEFG